MNLLKEIQDWFQNQCDGEWEHKHGINIESCDNPGWWVKISLKNTNLENKHFSPVNYGVSEDRMTTERQWLDCYIKDNVFNGAGDISKLDEILNIFVKWKNEE